MDKVCTYFLGCPTSDGFSTHIRELISAPEYTTYIIKGGPGTGKSSLMKRIANELCDIDMPDLYYCSSDPASLDAVVFNKLKVIVIDGTAPHVVEPVYPGVSQILVDLGSCWNGSELMKNKEKVIDATVCNKKYHDLVKRYLKAIVSLNDDVYTLADECINQSKLEGYCERVAARLFSRKKQDSGKLSYRQITSITPNGVLTHENVFEGMNVFKIEDDFCAVSDKILKALARYAVEAGYNVIVSTSVFHSCDTYEHIVIPELNTAFATGEIDASARINALRFYDRLALREKRKRMAFDRGVAAELIAASVAALKKAKEIHDELESYYINAMDFDKVSAVGDNLIARIKSSKQ